MATIAERIKEALSIRGMKQSELVKITGIGKSSISTYLSGEYEPKQRNIYKIAQALNVSESWLMGFDVPMKREQPSSTEQTVSSTPPEFKELYALINKLDSIDRAEIRGAMKQMLKADKYKSEQPRNIVKIAARNGQFEERPLSDSEIEDLLNLPDVDEF